MGTFLMGTSEFVVAGLLPDIAGDLAIGISEAGLLVTAFAIGMIATPAVAVAVLRVPERTTLLLSLAVFAAGHVVVALTDELSVVLVARIVPGGRSASTTVPLREQTAALMSRRLWVVMAACVLVTSAVMSTYSFIAPLLTERAGLSAELLPVGLAIFGVGAVTGTLGSGRLAGRAPYGTALGGGIAVVAALALLGAVSDHAAPAIALLAIAGLAGLGMNPVLMSMAVRFAEGAPTLATSLCTSMFNLGTAMGSAVTARAIGVFGPASIPVVGAAFAAALLVPLATLVIMARPGHGHRAGTTPQHDALVS
ncbi:MFS transporter [Rhodococcus sp. BP-316]|nr:MFS transporter [Rhodococcus sp. BP-316]